MEFLTLIAQPARAKAFHPRRSISHELLEKLIRAASLAPSCVTGLPCWHAEVVRSDEAKLRLSRLLQSAPHLAQAQLVLVFCADAAKAAAAAVQPHHRAGATDAAAAAATVRLAAVDFGLAVDWLTEFDAAKLRAALDLKPHLEPVVVLALGYEQ